MMLKIWKRPTKLHSPQAMHAIQRQRSSLHFFWNPLGFSVGGGEYIILTISIFLASWLNTILVCSLHINLGKQAKPDHDAHMSPLLTVYALFYSLQSNIKRSSRRSRAYMNFLNSSLRLNIGAPMDNTSKNLGPRSQHPFRYSERL